jgi:hypothetical protein
MQVVDASVTSRRQVCLSGKLVATAPRTLLQEDSANDQRALQLGILQREVDKLRQQVCSCACICQAANNIHMPRLQNVRAPQPNLQAYPNHATSL